MATLPQLPQPSPTGNTDPVGEGTPYTEAQKRRPRCRNWFFTHNNYSDTDISHYIFGFSNALKYAFQEEKGASGTRHLQGCVSFKDALDLSTMHKAYPKAHWEIIKDWKKSVAYCTKTDTRNGQVYTKGIPRPVQADIPNPYPWQATILAECAQDPHPRTINWIWEEHGKTGKTTLCKHLCLMQGAIYVSGKATDVKYAISTYLEAGQDIKIVLWDVPRSCQEYVSYEAIESVKNGIFFSAKYESKQAIFNTPHVYIFANFEPETDKLSQDRWNIRRINMFKAFD